MWTARLAMDDLPSGGSRPGRRSTAQLDQALILGSLDPRRTARAGSDAALDPRRELRIPTISSTPSRWPSGGIARARLVNRWRLAELSLSAQRCWPTGRDIANGPPSWPQTRPRSPTRSATNGSRSRPVSRSRLRRQDDLAGMAPVLAEIITRCRSARRPARPLVVVPRCRGKEPCRTTAWSTPPAGIRASLELARDCGLLGTRRAWA